MKVLTTRPVSRMRTLFAAAGACTALALAAGGPVALADCDGPCQKPVDTIQRHFLPVPDGLYKPMYKPLPPRPIHAPADGEPNEMPTLLPPAVAPTVAPKIIPTVAPKLTLPIVPGT
jgi:hypothetical protein